MLQLDCNTVTHWVSNYYWIKVPYTYTWYRLILIVIPLHYTSLYLFLMTCVVVKAQWGLHPRGMNARVPGYTGFIPSAKAEATKGLKPLVGPRVA